MIIVWRVAALLCIGLGLVGMVLPVLPTVPFLLLAAAAASKGWPWLDERLLAHEEYGPMILRWREQGIVPRRAKWFATAGMAASSALLWVVGVPVWLRISVPLLLFGVGVWIWSRPED